MNRDLILKQLRRPGPLVIRTSDCKEFPVPHLEFVLVGRFNVAIEDEAGAFDIIDSSDIVSISPQHSKGNAGIGIDFCSY